MYIYNKNYTLITQYLSLIFLYYEKRQIIYICFFYYCFRTFFSNIIHIDLNFCTCNDQEDKNIIYTLSISIFFCNVYNSVLSSSYMKFIHLVTECQSCQQFESMLRKWQQNFVLMKIVDFNNFSCTCITKCWHFY